MSGRGKRVGSHHLSNLKSPSSNATTFSILIHESPDQSHAPLATVTRRRYNQHWPWPLRYVELTSIPPLAMARQFHIDPAFSPNLTAQNPVSVSIPHGSRQFSGGPRSKNIHQISVYG